MEEDDARNEADGLDFIIGMEKYEKNVDNGWRELTEAEEACHFEREVDSASVSKNIIRLSTGK